jgi:membrane protein implicated in regulation of membrane protease activity
VRLFKRWVEGPVLLAVSFIFLAIATFLGASIVFVIGWQCYMALALVIGGPWEALGALGFWFLSTVAAAEIVFVVWFVRRLRDAKSQGRLFRGPHDEEATT